MLCKSKFSFRILEANIIWPGGGHIIKSATGLRCVSGLVSRGRKTTRLGVLATLPRCVRAVNDFHIFGVKKSNNSEKITLFDQRKKKRDRPKNERRTRCECASQTCDFFYSLFSPEPRFSRIARNRRASPV